MKPMDKFTLAYIECALWSSNDEEEVSFDSNFGLDDIHPDTLKSIQEDCKSFKGSEEFDLSKFGSDAQNGHDFWLTRNRHGAGFWDRGYANTPELRRCIEICHNYGSFELYVGDDGRIHGQ